MDFDETIEQIMEIFAQETQWKDRYASTGDEQAIVLNIEGVLRKRLTDLLTDFSDDKFNEATEFINENKEPFLDWSDLD